MSAPTYADIILRSLEGDGSALAYHAASTERHIRALETIPEFRTAAEARLEEAAKALTAALDAVQSAQRDIKRMRRGRVRLVAAE